MKHNPFYPLLAAASISVAAPVPLKFSSPPSLQVFPDGAVEWNASVKCPDPMALTGARIVFSFDFNLDGAPDGSGDSIALSSADCEKGEARFLKTLFPRSPGILTAGLWQGNTLSDQHSALAGQTGSLLSIRHFCARPSDGEPEWVEVHNASPGSVSLARIFFQGHGLINPIGESLGSNESVVLGRDSTSLRQWQPTADLLTTTSWSSLRNTGDTLRLTWGTDVVLDSLAYGTPADPREACSSTAADANAAEASGFALQVPSSRWNPDAGPLGITVQAPGGGVYDLRLYDLDGFELCAVARGKTGPAQIQFSARDCRGMRDRRGSLILQLQPRTSAPLRKLIRVGP